MHCEFWLQVFCLEIPKKWRNEENLTALKHTAENLHWSTRLKTSLLFFIFTHYGWLSLTNMADSRSDFNPFLPPPQKKKKKKKKKYLDFKVSRLRDLFYWFIAEIGELIHHQWD